MEVLKGRQSEEASKLEKRKKAIEVELSEVEPLIKVCRQYYSNTRYLIASGNKTNKTKPIAAL